MNDRLLTIDDVLKITGVSYATMYKWMKAGDFPSSKRVGKKTRRWLESEVNDWMKNLNDADFTELHCPSRLAKDRAA